MTETLEQVFEVGADGQKTLLSQRALEEGLIAGGKTVAEEYVVDEAGHRTMRRLTCNAMTMSNGAQGEETIEEDFEVLSDGRKALKKRTRRTTNVDGNISVVEEDFAINDEGESKLMKERKSEENHSPLKAPHLWKGDPKEITSGKENVRVLGQDGKKRVIQVKTERKAFENGMVRTRACMPH